MSKPVVITTTKPLPFDELEPLEFERLCLRLVEREGYKRPQHLGETGGEQGRDIVAYKQTGTGEELWYFQCKRRQRVGAVALKEEVDKYDKLAASDPTKRPVGIIFITTAKVTAKVRDDVCSYCQDHGYRSEFWARTELDMYVNKYPEIVEKFFSAPYVPATTTPHQLPSPPRDFTGRASELDELVSAFEQDGATICALHGMGGVGKTALALKLAERLTAGYPDAQIYLDLKGAGPEPLSVADAMYQVIRAFQSKAVLPTSEEELGSRYRSVLHGKKILLLLDDAADYWQVEPLMPPVGCALVATSRRRFHLPGLFAKNLDALPPDDARKLLLAIAPRISGLADVIADLCGHLPLALRSAAKALAERVDIGVGDYVHRLNDSKQQLEPVARALDLSYEMLDQSVKRLWCILSVFSGLFDVGAAAAVWETEQETTQNTLSELVRYSLVEWYEATARYRLHDLVRIFTDVQLSEAEREVAQRRHAEHYMNVLRTANLLFGKSERCRGLGLALFDLEWPNIKAGQSWAERKTGEDVSAASLCSRYPDAGAYLLHLRVHPTECIRWRGAALAAARRLNNRTEEAFHLGNLGMDYAALGQTRRGVELHNQALAISREIGDRRSEAHDLSNLGMSHMSLGEPDKATEFFDQSLSICRDIGDRGGEGLALGNLGIVYAAVGEYRRAIDYYEEALPILRETGNRRSEGDLLGSLGVVYAELGDVRRAVELYQSALNISQEVGDLRGVAQNLGNLGWVLAISGEDRIAFEYHQKQLSAARELGDPHCEGNALHGLGVIYSKARQHRHAVECFEQALKIIREGGHRFAEANALGDFGSAYLRAEELPKAFECYEEQLAIAREIRDKRGEASAIWNTAWALNILGSRDEAIIKGAVALEIFEGIGDLNQAAKLRGHLEQWRESAADRDGA